MEVDKELFLLTGSNLGNRPLNLSHAIEKLKAKFGKPLKVSAIYETAAWGNTKQSAFLNQVISFTSNLSPDTVLKTILDIELKMGRERNEKWGPRLIDIDILYYGEDVIQQSDLVIPHPFIQDRRFTLVPLNEIAPEKIHPVLKLSNKALLEQCKDELKVKIFATN